MLHHRPFLKWAGSKYRVLPYLLPRLLRGKRLVEPFVGSGAVFINTDYPHYLLADHNWDLINLYQTLQTEGIKFIGDCEEYFQSKYNRKAAYYKLREKFNKTKDHYLRAILFVYLNRHGYNGLCRYNRQGTFNVPFGSFHKIYFPRTRMESFYQKLQYAQLQYAKFEETFNLVKKGDIVYCDPPYLPLSKTEYFTAYNGFNFGIEEQERLATIASRLAKLGIPVLVSNHDTPQARELYQAAQYHSFAVQRYISCKGLQRKEVQELLAIYSNR